MTNTVFGLGFALKQVGPERREAVEAEVEALPGQVAEEVEDRVGVGALRRPQPERAPVPQDHVDDVAHAAHSPGTRRTSPSAAPAAGGVENY